jgi:hypothetical protein
MKKKNGKQQRASMRQRCLPGYQPTESERLSEHPPSSTSSWLWRCTWTMHAHTYHPYLHPFSPQNPIFSFIYWMDIRSSPIPEVPAPVSIHTSFFNKLISYRK